MPHYYTPTGEPAHFQSNKSKGGNRPTTLADAKKLSLLPGVTTILDLLRKPALERWLIQQAVMAVCTAPDVPGEGLDAKITRVLDTEGQQDEESRIARDRGTEIHSALEGAFNGQSVAGAIAPWLDPVLAFFANRPAASLSTEQILIGDGYGGKCDLQEIPEHGEQWIWDIKTAKKLPEKGAWWEHRMQCAAYAKARQQNGQTIRTGNIYISTVEPGKFVVCEHGDWWPAWEAFACLRDYWYLANGIERKEQNN